MKGNKKVLNALNDTLTAELAGINQYFLHSKMCAAWGYERLHQKAHEAAVGEMKHADILIERILFLGGIPNVQRVGRVSIGETVSEQMKLDLTLEADAIKSLNKAITLCAQVGDNGSAELLQTLLQHEEEHAAWLEAQLSIIKRIGEAQYLATQVHQGG